MSESTIKRMTEIWRATPTPKLIVLGVLALTSLLVTQGPLLGFARAGLPPVVGPGDPPALPAAQNVPSPRIEAVFVLDTTGSMSGLIEGAKQKIWSIANQMASAEQAPDIRLGMVAYRDRGDAYVTRRFDLSDDVDALYGELRALRAGGGGDGPESVNQALHEAVSQMSWSTDRDSYKVVFLVGDAPPHMDYQNDVPYAESLRMASDKGIVVNTIQCGADPSTRQIWQQISNLSQGQYAAIAQDGAMVAVTTPVDGELAALNRELAGTALAYGADEDRKALDRKLERARAAAPAAAAERLAYLQKKGGRLNSGRADLVDAVSSGEVELERLPERSLPEEMQVMSPEARRSYVEDKAKKRQQLKEKITSLVEERDAYLESEAAKSEGARPDAFDDRVLETIRAQAAEKGITY